jgi:hypothetical protein
MDAGRLDPYGGKSVTPLRTCVQHFGVIVAIAMLMMTSQLQAKEARSVPLGAYLGAGCLGVERLKTFRTWLGRDPDQTLEFISWEVLSKGTTWGVQCWAKGGRKNVVYSLPMLPPDKSATLADGASGKFDGLFRNYAQKLVKHGFGDSIIRIGWEFNADWYPWAAKHDPQSWIAYWRRIVTTMRDVPGAAFKFDWSAAGGFSTFRAEQVYPGDEYVDIIGLDYYNNFGRPDVTPQERWELRRKAPHGLDWHRQFATARGKPMSFPEWGTGKGRETHGGDDDPYFIEQMAQWMASNDVAYHNYWDYSETLFDSKLSAGRRPAAAAAFIRHFGKGSRADAASEPARPRTAESP